MTDDRSLAGVVDAATIVVTTGTGGVGKTTTSAAIALHGARSGRRTIVITIDPARRLADAMGISATANEPSRVDGPWAGELYALMLDTKGTFDTLVTRYARDETQCRRILDNRFYQNIAGALSGTQEYMAMEKLHALAESKEYDLIVVDTPPTRHALAFLDAPRLLTRLLDNRVYRLLMAPRGLVRAVNNAAHLFIRQITRIVGAEVVDDAIAFFRAFEGMEQGFTERAKTMIELLRSDDTAFVLVAAPRADTVVETKYFVGQLAASNINVHACVVNRMAPVFGAVRAKATKGLPHRQAVERLRDAAAAEEAHVAALIDGLGDIAVERVPMLASDLHDLEGIASIEALLFG
ncbi:MAG: ArsA-related P-loop ATPase [Acidimicrobiales bacterium]